MNKRVVRSMLFSELYGAYYNTVACIINKAISHPIKSTQIEEIIKEYAFSDSSLEISQGQRPLKMHRRCHLLYWKNVG